jgi:type I restriction enzyme S subunit
METNWIQPDALSERFTPGYYQQVFIENEQRRDRLPCQTLDQLRVQARIITNGIRGPELEATNYRMLRIQDLQLVFFCSEHALRVSESQYRANKRAWCFPGDILVSIGGELRLAGKVIDSHPQTMGQHTGLIPIDSSKVDGDYVLSYLSSETGKLDLTRYFAGSAQLSIDLEDLREVKVPIPDRSVQHAIGNKVRKAERLREIASDEQSRCDELIKGAWGAVQLPTDDHFGWAVLADTDDLRIDAWFHQPGYVQMGVSLRGRSDLVVVGELATRVEVLVRFDAFSNGFFDYFEISDMDLSSGTISSERVAVKDAPSRAKCAVRGGDLLVSTVRPNRKAIAIVPDDVVAAVCSSGFSVLRAKDIATAYFLRTCMIHDAVTHQLMRWNTGATYPAIEHEVPLGVFVPRFEPDEVQRIGSDLQKSAQHFRKAAELVCQAKNNVEALIAGTLEEAALLAEGEEIERWLRKNPSPNARKKAT